MYVCLHRNIHRNRIVFHIGTKFSRNLNDHRQKLYRFSTKTGTFVSESQDIRGLRRAQQKAHRHREHSLLCTFLLFVVSFRKYDISRPLLSLEQEILEKKVYFQAQKVYTCNSFKFKKAKCQSLLFMTKKKNAKQTKSFLERPNWHVITWWCSSSRTICRRTRKFPSW